MARTKLAPLRSVMESFVGIISTLRQQKMYGAIVLAVILSILAIIFSFLAFSPMLSPFLYPLF
jgi:hypothetical protein